MKEKITAVILAAGNGSRMNMDVTKQRITLNGVSVLKRSAMIFDASEEISDIVVVVRADEIEFWKEELSEIKKLRKVVVGGKSRFDSSKIGFLSIPEDTDLVAIHDGARCFLSQKMLSMVISDAKKYGAASASSFVTDTVKTCDVENKITGTVDRERLRLVQTPQIFRTELYQRALVENKDDETVTDDNMLLEKIGVRVHLTETGKGNIKITTQEDFLYADFLLSKEKNQND